MVEFGFGGVMYRVSCNRWVDSRQWIGRVAIENAVASVHARFTRKRIDGNRVEWYENAIS